MMAVGWQLDSLVKLECQLASSPLFLRVARPSGHSETRLGTWIATTATTYHQESITYAQGASCFAARLLRPNSGTPLRYIAK